MQNNQLPVSIIIPVYNEALMIENLLHQLSKSNFDEVIIVDGRSTDATVDLIKQYDVHLIIAEIRSRSFQMNLGANSATNDYLLFLHADIVLPEKFRSIIEITVEKKVALANFKIQFDWDHWFLKANAFFSRFRWNCFQFGDQGLLIKTSLFKKIEGYNNQFYLAEGNELIRRARKYSNFIKLDVFLLISVRKYLRHGVYKLQLIYCLIYLLIRVGVNQKLILNSYHKLLKD